MGQQRIDRIQKLEEPFLANFYNGKGTEAFVIKEGTIPVMLSAPHAVNHFRNGNVKKADKMTGGIAEYLHQTLGCHLIVAEKFCEGDPNYDPNDAGENAYQTALTEYVRQHRIAVLIDLHGVAKEREYAIEIGTAPAHGENRQSNPSLQGREFLWTLVRLTFEYVFKGLPDTFPKAIWKNRLFAAGNQNTITKHIYQNTQAACFQLEVNGWLRDPSDPEGFERLLDGLTMLISILAKIDWTAEVTEVLRLRQAAKHKPQDKIEMTLADHRHSPFSQQALLFVCSTAGKPEMVRLHAKEGTAQGADGEVFLTNRLIRQVCGEPWDDRLADYPIVVYEHTGQTYPIGLPKADRIEGITLSSALYKALQPWAATHDFIVFNRFTDSRFYIKYEEADYGDGGRLKAEKVMMPRYHKRLLGYLDSPPLVVRKEQLLCVKQELSQLLAQPTGDVLQLVERFRLLEELGMQESPVSTEVVAQQGQRLCQLICQYIDACYEPMRGEVFCKLRKELCDDEQQAGTLELADQVFRLFGSDKVELLRVPRVPSKALPWRRRVREALGRVGFLTVKQFIGSSEYLLKTKWTSETDDQNGVARLSTNMMSLLGVTENDKIRIKFEKKVESLRVLASADISDYEVGIPAPARMRMGMNSINDIVLVERNVYHIFWRNSKAQTIAILGTILAVIQLHFDSAWLKAVVCLLAIVFILWVILFEERIKVNRLS